jgi:hypothetical protein
MSKRKMVEQHILAVIVCFGDEVAEGDQMSQS